MADLPETAYKCIKEGITIEYSDITFYWNVLHGEAHRYWWEVVRPLPTYGAYNMSRFTQTRESS